MERQEIYKKLNEVFKEVLDLEELSLTDETTANDVEGWDSLAHITLISEVEEEFHIKIPMKAVLSMKNVGELVNIIQEGCG